MDQPAFTIKQFCYTFSISRSFLYKLWDKGEGPSFFKIGGSIRISRKAAEEWQSRNEVRAKPVAVE